MNPIDGEPCTNLKMLLVFTTILSLSLTNKKPSKLVINNAIKPTKGNKILVTQVMKLKALC